MTRLDAMELVNEAVAHCRVTAVEAGTEQGRRDNYLAAIAKALTVIAAKLLDTEAL